MFGLLNKGHFSEGADADITVIDPDAGRATRTFIAGKPALVNGEVMTSGGTLLVTPAGKGAAEDSSLPHEVIDLQQSKLYAGFNL